MIGNELGADNIKKAIHYSKKFAILVTLVGAIFGLLLIISIPGLIKLFSVSDQLMPDIKKIFVIMGILMALKTFGLTYTEEVVKFIFGVPRAISKKWAQNLVKNI